MTTMRMHLTRTFAPLVLGPLVLATLWSGAMSYFKGSDSTGWGWTGQGARAFSEFLEETGLLALSRIGMLSQVYEANQPLNMEDSELFAAFRGGELLVQLPGRHLQDLSPQDIHYLIPSATWDYRRLGARLFFSAIESIDQTRYLLVKEIDLKYLYLLQSFNGSEVTLYLDHEPVLSTWRNLSDEMLLPRMSSHMQALLADNNATPIVQFKDVAQIENYRGFPAGGLVEGKFQKIYDAGANQIRTYHSVLTIKDRRGQTLAYLDIALPRSAVLEGPIYAITGSIILFVLLTVVSVFVVRRIADAYAKPLAAMAKVSNEVTRTISARLPTAPVPPRGRRPDGLPMELATLGVAIYNLKRIVEAWHETEAELAKSRQALVQSAKMSALGEMAGRIAHEISTPLTVIQGRARHILRALAAEPVDVLKAREHAQTIDDSIAWLGAIVHGLKNYSRSGDLDPFERCDLREILREVLILCAERCQQDHIELRFEEAPHGDWIIEARAVQISQVLLNLLNNAHDAVENLPERWISMTLEDLGPQIRIRVIDSGRGIPHEIRDKVMQPFFTTKAIGKGTGFGLSVSKDIVDAHGGTLSIDHEHAHTCFVLDLPKVATKATREVA